MTPDPSDPASAPIVLPAEWAPQAFVQLTWPRPEGDFAFIHDNVVEAFVCIARAIARHTGLLIATAEPETVTKLLHARGVEMSRTRVMAADADDVWARDHGPITVFEAGRPVHLDFTFNGWGGKFDADRDNALTRALGAAGAYPGEVRTLDFVLEGGGIESDGAGTLLTTERCLLAPTRNPGLDRAAIEAKLKTVFGLQRILWLRHGDLLGDDTDGHIDTIARFTDTRTIVWQDCDDPTDAHHADLKALGEELGALQTLDGAPYRLVGLPLPRPIQAHASAPDARRLPAGYANFLITDGAVLVPTYDQPATDAIAIARLGPLFPGRVIEGVDCRALVEQYGSLHCVTMQVPA